MSTDTKALPDTGSEPSALRLVLTLTIAGLISGLAIVSIFEVTLPTITANKARELREAVFKVLPGVSNMQKLVFKKDALQPSTEKIDDAPFVYGGYDDEGKFIGYALPGQAPGFADTIKILYGYRPAQGIIVGMEVLESRETPGLGDKIYKDADFVANFTELAVQPKIVTVKKGAKSAPNEVEAITGATISSKVIVKIMNNTHQEWISRLPPPGSEPSLKLAPPPTPSAPADEQ
ncbi:MAG: FMN-binding protein [Pseudomonadota bacterium]